MNQPEPNELIKRYRMTRFLMVIVLAVNYSSWQPTTSRKSKQF